MVRASKLKSPMKPQILPLTLIAAVDLAHIGPRFGDQWRVDRLHQDVVERADQERFSRAQERLAAAVAGGQS